MPQSTVGIREERPGCQRSPHRHQHGNHFPNEASIGIGLAIPVNMKKVLGDLVKGGGLKRGFLGVSLEESPTVQGAIIDSVEPNSPAEQAGLKPARRHREGGREVSCFRQSTSSGHFADSTRYARYLLKLRNGKEMDFFVTLDFFARILLPRRFREFCWNR